MTTAGELIKCVNTLSTLIDEAEVKSELHAKLWAAFGVLVDSLEKRHGDEWVGANVVFPHE
jgi:hypothetical protein